MLEVFLCHSSKDEEFVNEIKGGLEAHGVKCWIYTEDMLPGETIITSLSEAIIRGDFVLAFISENALKSSWVMEELSQAKTKEVESAKDVIIPIKLDDSEMPSFLKPKFYADFTGSKNHIIEFNKILKKIGVLEKRERLESDVIQRTRTYEDGLERFRSILGAGIERENRVKKDLYDRFANIEKSELPVNFCKSKPFMFLCIKPVAKVEIDIEKLKGIEINPIGCIHRWSHIKRKAVVFSDNDSLDNENRSYVYFRTDGYLEACNRTLFELEYRINFNFVPTAYEEEAISSFSRFLNEYKKLEIALPFIAYFGLLNVKDLEFCDDPQMRSDRIKRYLSDNSFISEPLEIDSYEIKVHSILQPIFNEIWQSAGHIRSYNYDEDSNWVGQNRQKKKKS